MQDLIAIAIVSTIFLIIFAVAEILYKKGTDVEFTRKFTHFAGTFVTLSFPFIIQSHFAILGLGTAFAMMMFFTKKSGLLRSVHGVARKSDGAIYQPLAIYLCFIYSQILNQPWFYVIAVSILAISDASAALVGKTYGTNAYVVEVDTKKTFEGSITFLLTAFLITHLILLLTTPLGRLECVLVAVLISILSAIFESVSLKGADNLFIPLAVMFILSKNIHPTVYGISFQIAVLLLFVLGYLISFKPYKRIGGTGVLLLGLINYVVWALMGNIYAAIILSFSLICAKTNLVLNYDCDAADSYRVRPVFYILAIPVTCSFLVPFLGDLVIFPFVTSIITEGIIIRTRCFNGNLNKGLWTTSILSIIVLGVSYVLIR